jgi:hypothetical protein
MVSRKQWAERQETINCFISEAQAVGSPLSVSDIENICDKLHRYETSLHRISEIQCCIEMSEKETKRLDEKEERINQKVRDIAELLRFKVRFQGDPRGGAIRFILPSGRSNGWDLETWGIYW